MPEELLTIYGRMPVLEALKDDHVNVAAVFVTRTARGDSIGEILHAAEHRGIKVQRIAPERLSRISGNSRHDQGVAAEVVVPGLQDLEQWLEGAPASFRLFLLDGVTNPSNVGMIVRTAVAAGFDGVIVPTSGVAALGPLVIKASAGVAFSATLLRADGARTAVEMLRAAGVTVVGLASDGGQTIYDLALGERMAFVLGSETVGVTVDVDEGASIPLRGGVDSLNVATAAAVTAFEIARRRNVRNPS